MWNMRTKQTIMIIGASGRMGSAISKSLSGGNYRLLLNGKNHDKINDLINEIDLTNPLADVEGIDCSFDGCWEADIIISAVPYLAEKEMAERIKEVANQKIVISIANPLNKNYNGLLTAADTSAAEELQKELPNSKVIKAFNTTFAADFSTPVINGQRTDAFIAGNDEDALNNVAEIIHTAGFNPVIAGDLSVSRTLENMQLLLVQLNKKYNYNELAGWKILHN
ncbi:MAG: NAD(P)-binding domain-containing protein [Ginsengibacter sp.]